MSKPQRFVAPKDGVARGVDTAVNARPRPRFFHHFRYVPDCPACAIAATKDKRADV